MYDRKLKKHIHPFKAYTFIGLVLFFSIWLVSVANPNKVNADDDTSLNTILNEKDSTIKVELAKPEEINNVTDISISAPVTTEQINSVETNSADLNLTILPIGIHQSTKSVITIIASSNINPKSLEDAFSIVPAVAGKFSIHGRVATFTPEKVLDSATNYTVTIDARFKDMNGISLTKPVVGNFETNPETHILAVPYYRQIYSRSCEAAALRMALAYRGVNTEDLEIVKAAGYKPRNPNWAKKIWDDPYEMFVGYITGENLGYGMYASALQKALNYYNFEGQVLTNPTVQDIAQEIKNNNPVVVWGYISGTTPRMSYFYTEDGKRVPVYSNEHARTVVGVVGDATDPIGFYINDPLNGKQNEYWTAVDLAKHMNIFGAVSNQALVVR